MFILLFVGRFQIVSFQSQYSRTITIPFHSARDVGLVMQVLHENTEHSINREKMVSILLLAYRVSE